MILRPNHWNHQIVKITFFSLRSRNFSKITKICWFFSKITCFSPKISQFYSIFPYFCLFFSNFSLKSYIFLLFLSLVLFFTLFFLIFCYFRIIFIICNKIYLDPKKLKIKKTPAPWICLKNLQNGLILLKISRKCLKMAQNSPIFPVFWLILAYFSEKSRNSVILRKIPGQFKLFAAQGSFLFLIFWGQDRFYYKL